VSGWSSEKLAPCFDPGRHGCPHSRSGASGYVLCTLIASGLILRILSVKSWRVLIITSLCVSMGTYLLFDRLLGIDLP